jgi:hypothetical protein
MAGFRSIKVGSTVDRHGTAHERARREPNVLVTPDPAPQNEPAVGVHLLDPRIVVAGANDYRLGPPRIGIYRSTDGGYTWRNRMPPLPPGHVNSGDAVVAYGYPDLFLVGGAAYKEPTQQGEEEIEGGGSIIVYRSEDAGATFSEPIIIMEGFDQHTFNDKPWFAVDTAAASPYQGRAYVAYTRFMNPGTIILFQRSEDGCRTWSEPVPLTGIEPWALGTFVAVGQLGEVYVAWVEEIEPEEIQETPRPAAQVMRERETEPPETHRARFVLRRSLDGGRTFGPRIVVSQFLEPEVEQGLAAFVPEFTFRVFTFAFLGVDQSTGPDGGTVYAVWHQLRQTSGGRNADTVDVMMSFSEDRGLTWSRPRKVTDTPDSALAFDPFISVSPTTGTVNIVYYTNRVVRDRLDVFLVRAVDHGRRFLRDQRVTTRSFDPNAADLGPDFIGDYIGVAVKPADLPKHASAAEATQAAHQEQAIAVWCDTRRGNEDIFAAPDL